MKFTPFIVAAVLAYTGTGVPVHAPNQQNSEVWLDRRHLSIGIPQNLGYQRHHDENRHVHEDHNLETKTHVQPRGIFDHNFSNVGVLEDVSSQNTIERHNEQVRLRQGGKDMHRSGPGFDDLFMHVDNHPDSLDDLPTITDIESQHNIKVLSARAANWRPDEIDNYHEGTKIDVKNSILELKDKFVYLNKAGRLTIEEVDSQIETYRKVIAARFRRNHVNNPPDYVDMLSALRSYIVAEIQARPQDAKAVQPLSKEEQDQQDIYFSNLHAHYIVEGLKEKILRLAQLQKLTKRLSTLAVSQARDLMKITTKMPQEDLDRYNDQIKQIGKVVSLMVKKHLTEFPASAVPPSLNPTPFNYSDESGASLNSTTDETSESPATEELQDMMHVAARSIPDNEQVLSSQNSSSNSTRHIKVSAYRAAKIALGAFLEQAESESPQIVAWPLTKRDDNSTAPPDIRVEYTIDAKPENEDDTDCSFWDDYGAPECMQYILTDNLDLESLKTFGECQALAEVVTANLKPPGNRTEGLVIEKDLNEVEKDE